MPSFIETLEKNTYMDGECLSCMRLLSIDSSWKKKKQPAAVLVLFKMLKSMRGLIGGIQSEKQGSVPGVRSGH